MKLKTHNDDDATTMQKFSLYPSGIRQTKLPNGSYNEAVAYPESTLSLREYISDVANGRWSDEVGEHRYEPDPQRKKVLKEGLPYITPHAVFANTRLKNSEYSFSGLIMFDIDAGKDGNPNEIGYVVPDGHVAAQHRSVGGTGLRIFYHVEGVKVMQFKQAVEYVKAMFEKQFGIYADKSCKDITRASFVSFDADAEYYESEPMRIPPTAYMEPVKTVAKEVSLDGEWNYERTQKYISDCLHRNMSRTETLQIMLAMPKSQWSGSGTFGFGEADPCNAEIHRLVDDLYSRYGDQRGQGLNKQINLGGKVKKYNSYRDMEGDSGLYQRVKHLLPRLLQDVCENFTREGDQDTALISALPLFGQLLINTYFDMGSVGIQNSNLFTYILGDAGSGKSVMGQVVKMFQGIEAEFRAERARRTTEYKLYMECNEKEKKELRDSGRPVPTNPFTGFLVPADTTAAALIRNANDTCGLGVMVASEADTVSRNIKGEHGISAFLRNAYEGEYYDNSRIGDGSSLKAPVFIDRVNLSMLVSSTPDQVKAMMGNVDNGLFSRFMFEILPSTEKIISMWKTKKIDHSAMQLKLLEFYKKSGYVQKVPSDDPMKQGRSLLHEFVEPRDEDYVKYIDAFDGMLQDLVNNVSKSLSASTTRAVTRMFRVGMILSSMKILEHRDLGHTEEFDTASLEAAFEIVATSLNKNVNVLSLFGEEVKTSKNKDKTARNIRIADRVKICEEVSGMSEIEDKDQEVVDRLNVVGDMITFSSFKRWRVQYEKSQKGSRFW